MSGGRSVDYIHMSDVIPYFQPINTAYILLFSNKFWHKATNWSEVPWDSREYGISTLFIPKDEQWRSQAGHTEARALPIGGCALPTLNNYPELLASYPVPRPAFCRLQYGKAGRAWYIYSRE